MSLAFSQSGRYSERVCTHKFEFTTMRTSLFSHQGRPPIMFFILWSKETEELSGLHPLSANMLSMHPKKYRALPLNQSLIFLIVLTSQHTDITSSSTIHSTVSVQCLLYGISISGSSWCILQQQLHFNRRITNVHTVPIGWIYFRFLLPTTFNSAPQTGQMLFSLLLT